MATKRAVKVAEADAMEQTSQKSISLPKFEVARLMVHIVGTTPVIPHRFGPLARRALEGSQQGPKPLGPRKPRDARNPEAELEDGMYRMPDGRPALPSNAFKRAIVVAGQRYAGAFGTELMGSFAMLDEFVLLDSPTPPRMRADLVRLSGPSRTASIAYRNEFMPWKVDLAVTLYTGFLPLDQFLNLVNLAGFTVGIGDWRPDRKGWAGQFETRGIDLVAEQLESVAA